ncbi:hypothetical protein J5X98_00775 [Leptothermofonsia sichuanensis E412]|uniref:hypothetical protein n=1 Tax=Leptothermofonsia sichuanensis TaxID=2917832 RepID=UPI001CA680AF|nr:hypothetical protein [Leptothermofonsia sichuanensis]QZZ21080.1 hypothetical protein J5X98_00775 [Leptothermofonsia sichuanensis E412]
MIKLTTLPGKEVVRSPQEWASSNQEGGWQKGQPLGLINSEQPLNNGQIHL